ncbi:hypothetical protein EGW08_016876 [Elysia chlorotica]|uniref:GIY-YIG domain-containing protein n=1 Tax=Elysia chlorotica TaxID=188477 RepID=A0A433T1D9_ELYCH|nr:hypothetical protein EGW08_016876 [Elysia chlorotica]
MYWDEQKVRKDAVQHMTECSLWESQSRPTSGSIGDDIYQDQIIMSLRRYFPLLHSSDRCRKAIPHLPMPSYRRPRNLRDTLVHSTVPTNNTHTGSSPCNVTRCMTCPYITSTSTFQSSTNGKTHNITHNLSCKSHNVIYLIACTKCNKQYVGQTSQTLRNRFTNHRFAINNDRDQPVARHFNLPGHTIKDLNITPIDQLITADTFTLTNKETYWIHTLQTMTPNGMNINNQSQFPILALANTAQ